jgi:hypothetical protein
MSDSVNMQLDVGNVPNAVVSTTGLAQSLLKAVSADSVNPLSVEQTRHIGACFHSNGPFAAKLPDLLTRSSSVRLERLSAWIGWVNGDTASYMSKSSAGRTASLLCFVLGNLYSKDTTGSLLYELSERILPKSQQNSSMTQLSQVSTCLESKLNCMGFGNHFATELTRLRECYFQSGLTIPFNLADIPSRESMIEFLVSLRDALQNEDRILVYNGTQAAGTLISLILCLCPDDARIIINEELVFAGQRNSITFNISESQPQSFHIEFRMRPQTDDVPKHFIQASSFQNTNSNLKLSWRGWLSSSLDIFLATTGALPNNQLACAIASLAAALITCSTGRDWCPDFGKEFSMPKDGLRTMLGPDFKIIIQNRMEHVLAAPMLNKDLLTAHNELEAVLKLCLSSVVCSCGDCNKGHLWDDCRSSRTFFNTKDHVFHRKTDDACPISFLWLAIADIIASCLWSCFVEASCNASIRITSHRKRRELGGLFRSIIFRLKYESVDFLSETVHNNIFDLVNDWDHKRYRDKEKAVPPAICLCSKYSTILPSTLQYPRIDMPWNVQYNLFDGTLHNGSIQYLAILCAEEPNYPSHVLLPDRVTQPLSKLNSIIQPSSIGAHDMLEMTLRPSIVGGIEVLMLRTTIYFNTHLVDVNFLDIHIGFLCCFPAAECEHHTERPLQTPIDGKDVRTTSVISPLPESGKLECVAITLTHRNKEAQFLCCAYDYNSLYQAGACLECAVKEAQRENIKLVIGS